MNHDKLKILPMLSKLRLLQTHPWLRSITWQQYMCAGLGIILILQCIYLGEIDSHDSGLSAVRLSSSPAHPTLNIGIITHTPLFGIYESPADALNQAHTNFKIVGLFFSENPEESHVILRNTQGKEISYKVNAILDHGIVIKHILKDAIIIMHNGTLERLDLPRHTLHIKGPPQGLEKEK